MSAQIRLTSGPHGLQGQNYVAVWVCLKETGNIGYILVSGKKIYRLTEAIRWKYIQIFLSFSANTSKNVTKTKPTWNIGYILTEFDEKNTTEVVQLMQQMLLYWRDTQIWFSSNPNPTCLSKWILRARFEYHILTVKVIIKITLFLSLRLFSHFRLSQRKSIKYKSPSLACFILAVGSAAETLPSYHWYYNEHSKTCSI